MDLIVSNPAHANDPNDIVLISHRCEVKAFSLNSSPFFPNDYECAAFLGSTLDSDDLKVISAGPGE